jgi:hypothetical protein
LRTVLSRLRASRLRDKTEDNRMMEEFKKWAKEFDEKTFDDSSPTH